MFRYKSFLTLLMILAFILLVHRYSDMLLPEPEVFLNGEKIIFETVPVYVEGELLVPLRTIFEALGAEVAWDENNQSIDATKNGVQIQMRVGSKTALLNDEEIKLGVAPLIIDNRTFVPLLFTAEVLGAAVVKMDDSRKYFLNTGMNGEKPDIVNSSLGVEEDFSFRGIAIGDSEELLLVKWGQPARKDLSEYGFYWYIYNQNYNNYIQVGIANGRVVAIYTNSDFWDSQYGIRIGTSKESMRAILGQPLQHIIKQGVKYIYQHESDHVDRFLVNGYYLIAFYDEFNENRLTAIFIIDESTEKSLFAFVGNLDEEVLHGYERQLYDLTNSIRARMGKKTLQWDELASQAARKHSVDMANRDYFAHESPEGNTPFYRMEQEGIRYRAAAENIAAGVNAIFSHESLMNSYGHRKSILMDIQRMGVGSAKGNQTSQYELYHTQNFYTPR